MKCVAGPRFGRGRLVSLLTAGVPFDAQPCEEVDERGYRLTYEDKQPRENLGEER